MIAFRVLRDRAVYPTQVDELLESVLSDPDAIVRDVVIRLTGPAQYLRVSTTPFVGDGSGGRVWSFDDITAEMMALARVEVAADEAAESRARYQLLAQHASDIVFRGDADGLLDWVSDSVREVLGYDPATLHGDLFLGKLHPEDLETVAGKGAHFLDEDRATFRGRFLTAWGDYRWLEVTARLVPSPDGQSQLCIGSARNIDAEVQAEQALEESEVVMRAIVDAMLDPHVLLEPVHDADGKVADFRYVGVNAATVKYLGLDRSVVEGRTMHDFLPEGYDDTLMGAFVDAFENGSPLVIDGFRYPSEKFNGTRYFDVRGTRVGDRLSVTWRDVTDRLVLAQRLEHAARTDPLTGVLNRAAGVELAGAKLQARRLPGNHVALLFCDIDHFKELNDAFGHRSGDTALQTMADRIREVVRGGDVVARLGGDEFLVVLDGVHGQDDALAIGEKVRRACSAPIVIDHGVIRPSMSVGAVVGEHGDDFDVLLARADAAMYVAKGRGRNRVVAATPDVVGVLSGRPERL
jgi:diguanylate cyclase (GGDEF)-like protein/PAS domain S-box-containing protein